MSVNFRACTKSDLIIVQNHVLSLYQEDPPAMEMNPRKVENTFWEFTNRPDKGHIIVFEKDNTVARYPQRKNPKIQEPTISIGQLVPSRSILVEREYEFESFTGKDRVKSQFFPELDLSVEQIIAFGAGI